MSTWRSGNNLTTTQRAVQDAFYTIEFLLHEAMAIRDERPIFRQVTVATVATQTEEVDPPR